MSEQDVTCAKDIHSHIIMITGIEGLLLPWRECHTLLSTALISGLCQPWVGSDGLPFFSLLLVLEECVLYTSCSVDAI